MPFENKRKKKRKLSDALPLVVPVGPRRLVYRPLALVALVTRSSAVRQAGCRGMLTLDGDGILLETGSERMFLGWNQPIQVRKWGVGQGGRPIRFYEVWELRQGMTRIRLSRRVAQCAVKDLVLKRDTGWVIPAQTENVFDLLARLGHLQMIDPPLDD